MSVAGTEDIEDVESFQRRAGVWIREHLKPFDGTALSAASHARGDKDEEDAVERAASIHDRELQRMLFDGGFAGICVPREYGGQGLTPEHQRALNEELVGREYPSNPVPTFSPCAAILLEFGSEEQKARHIPAILKGEEIWMQFLSEPSGGSDVASALTSAVRDGDEWVLNGSKVWTSGAWWADWALCLARTNWDVPKHRGLTVFILPIHQPGIELQRIEMLDGSRHFCQEFLTDVRVPDTDRIGEVDDGWTVGTRWLFHERMSYSSPYVTVAATGHRRALGGASLVSVARATGRLQDPYTRDRIGESRMLDVAVRELQRRLRDGMTSGKMTDQAAAIARLFHGHAHVRRTSIGFEAAGTAGVAWSDDDGPARDWGLNYLIRQATCIGGGTTEMAANVVSERVLGMPRERALDRDIPFRDVPRGPTTRG